MAAKEPGRDLAEPGPFRLAPSSFLAILFLSVSAMALAYVGGVMSGRHMVDAPPQAAAEASTAEKEAGSPQKILAAEELEFARVLRGQAARPKDPPPAPQKNARQERSGAGVSPDEAKEEPAPAGEPVKAAETPGQKSMFDYVFQLGAFRDEMAADNLREKLEGQGLRTFMKRDGKLLVIFARMRGDEGRVAELESLAKEFRLGKPMRVSRKPVAQ